jgi:4-amino-4-deoxy-L-arabinose transferase-like glycosyltransferase
MFPNIRFFELTLEEPRRALVAYEMWFSGSYLQPTLLGEPYFNKPPLFNWLIVLSSMLFGWGGLAVRAVSLAFTALTALVVYLTAKRIIGGREVGLLAALIYVTLADTCITTGG